MAKEKETTQEQEQLQEQEQTATPTAEAGEQTPVEELIANGTTTISASAREELFTQFDDIKAALPEGVQVATGAVGYSTDTQLYTLRIDVV